jgi:hypothetical protein
MLLLRGSKGSNEKVELGSDCCVNVISQFVGVDECVWACKYERIYYPLCDCSCVRLKGWAEEFNYKVERLVLDAMNALVRGRLIE